MEFGFRELKKRKGLIYVGFSLFGGYVRSDHGHGALAMKVWLCYGEKSIDPRDQKELFTFFEEKMRINIR